MNCKIFSVILLISTTLFSMDNQNPHLLVVIPTYRNKDYCIENIQSLVEQTYTNWTAVIIVDGRPADDDGTIRLIEDYINAHDLNQKITMVKPGERRLALHNIYETIHKCRHDDWVVVLYDGDDFFYTQEALARVAIEYQDPNTWITYGQYINYPAMTLGNCRALPASVLEQNSFRKQPFVMSHLRTFKVWLFKKIMIDDLVYNKQFYPTTWDLALMYPMLEMASHNHIKFIPDILYVYRHHDRNDYATNLKLQLHLDGIIRHRARYQPLNKAPTMISENSNSEAPSTSKKRSSRK